MAGDQTQQPESDWIAQGFEHARQLDGLRLA
jgi:hypothetical protein